MSISAAAPQQRRQSGFEVPSQSSDSTVTPNTPRTRTTTSGTIVGATAMDEESSAVPLPIPRSSDPVDMESAAASAMTPSDLPTPPDGVSLPRTSTATAPSAPASASTAAVKLASSTSTHKLSGSPSANFFAPSSSWSHSKPQRAGALSSIRPYLSTSYRTSAERGGRDIMDDDEEEEEDDDEYGDVARRLPIHRPPESEDGDSMFSFSSPYLRPQSLEPNEGLVGAPAESPDPRGPAGRLMSPGWTASTLGRMTLGSPEQTSGGVRRPSRGAGSGLMSQFQSVGSGSPQSSGPVAGGSVSRSLPSSSASLFQSRRLSFGRRPPLSHGASNGPYSRGSAAVSSASPAVTASPAGGSRARSRSRSRLSAISSSGATSTAATSAATPSASGIKDDDETDEEMDHNMGMALDDMELEMDLDDDDATEDEADGPARAGRSAASRPAGDAQTLRASNAAQAMHRYAQAQSQPLVASRSQQSAGSHRPPSLARQYSSLSFSRHHPYATSPGTGVSQLSLSYSPSTAGPGFASGSGAGTISSIPRAPIDRRSSSSSTAAAVLYGTSPGAAAAFGHHSPRYAGMHQAYTASRPSYGSYTSNGSFHGYMGAEEEEGEEEGEEEEGSEEGEEDENGDVSGSVAPAASAPRKSRPSGGGGDAGTSNDANTPEMAAVNAIRDRLGGAANCSAFISKLWYLMVNPDLYSRYLRWSEAGDSIILINDADISGQFAKDVLPKLFKHGNNASFVRQLNLYGFQRIPSSRLLDAAEAKAARLLRNGSSISTALQLYGAHSSFSHPKFRRGGEDALTTMKPRSSKKPKKGGAGATPGSAPGSAKKKKKGGDEEETDEEDFALA